MAAFYSLVSLMLQVLLVNAIIASTSMNCQPLREVTISLNLENATLAETFESIEKETDYKFLYLEDELPCDARVSLKLKDGTMFDVLEKLSLDHRLSFKRVNKNIAVKPNEKEVEDNSQKVLEEYGAIKGKVIYEQSGEPVFGRILFF